MGPRLLSRGDLLKDTEKKVLFIELQWGHGFSAVEMATISIGFPSSGMLQWGHGFSAVEMTWTRLRDLCS